MAQILSNISHIPNIISSESIKEISFSERAQKIEKIKYNLGLLYFAGFAILLTTLFL